MTLNEAPVVPDLLRLGPHITVPFPVRRLPQAEVVWLNRRWWIAHGSDISKPAVRRNVEQELLGRFAVIACEDGEEPDESEVLRADRYGGSFGSHHGGSGRCGLSGCYNAKGIGRTPLVPPEASGIHGDGCLSMSEAIREAVSAEVAAHELPFGSVPVVAILYVDRNGGEDSRGEAILVRPNFIRPAHFERSIFFGTSGHSGSDQHLDALRTHHAVATASQSGAEIGFPGLMPMLERCARQIGASQAHRLWQGRFLSSNVTISGALVDFGSFRSVPSWRAFFGEPEEEFGREGEYLQLAWRSLRHSFSKYAPQCAQPQHVEAVERLTAAQLGGFRAAVGDALGLEALKPDAAEAVREAIRAYFARQQVERLQVAERANWTLPWLHDILEVPERTMSASYTAERLLLHRVGAATGGRENRWLHQALRRWTRPRPKLHYESSAIAFDRAARAIRRAPGRRAAIMDALIRSTLSAVSRSWKGVPLHFEVHGQTCHEESTVLYGFDHRRLCWSALTKGTGHGGDVHLFGTELEQEAASGWRQIDTAPGVLEHGVTATLAGRDVALPAARFHYHRRSSERTFRRP